MMPQPPTYASVTDRSHFTRTREPKKALTVHQARKIIADNPAMVMYTCDTCGQVHVGNRPLNKVVA